MLQVSERQPFYNGQYKLIANTSLDYIVLAWDNCGDLSFNGNRMNENIGNVSACVRRCEKKKKKKTEKK